VTYNEPFEGSLVSVTKLDLFVDGVPKSIESCKGKGQIAIYYPKHACFEHYDVIVVIWDKGGILNAMIGYDLKEGKGLAERQAPDCQFIKSFVIKDGAAAIAFEEKSIVLFRGIRLILDARALECS